MLNNTQTYQLEQLYLPSLPTNSYYNTDNFQQTQNYFDPLHVLETAHIVQEAHEALYERPAVNNRCQCSHDCLKTVQILSAQVQELQRDVAILKNQQRVSKI